MKKLSFVLVFMSALIIACFTATGCSDKKAPAQDSISSQDSLDSVSVPIDTVATLISEAPMPKAADELFDDFIFNFGANRRLQLKRIQFPLREYHDGKLARTFTRKQWRMEHFFMRQDFYTLILDDMKQLAAVKDTTVSHVVVEKIFLDEDMIRQYVFNRMEGQWKMTSINQQEMRENRNGGFLRFYRSFATDSAFQCHHLNDPVYFSGPDPDDDFGTITGEIAPETWPAFAPQLPTGVIYNIIYGKNHRESHTKIFMLRGIANGLEMWLTFKHEGERWMLTKLNT